jgi:heterodisulfide reductase subunit A
MPADREEIHELLNENIEVLELTNPTKATNEGLECVKMELGEPDESGRRRPEVVEGSEEIIPVDVAVLAIGLLPSTKEFTGEMTHKRGFLESDERTLQTTDPVVFAGGDSTTAPTMIINAIAQGRRAAFHMDLFLKGESMDKPFDILLEKTDKSLVLDESKDFKGREPVPQPMLPIEARKETFDCYEKVMTEEEARKEAHRCMNCGECAQCMECVNVCPAFCIDFSIREQKLDFTVGAVVLSTGYEILDPSAKKLLGYGKIPDVIDGPQMDRLLAPTRPYNSVLRPSDGKEPESIAIVLCNGSRDKTVCNPLCCRIGCMYSVKHAQLAMGALPLADVTIYYIDVRAFGKGYDEFYEQSKDMGIEYVKGKVARVEQLENGNMELYYEDMSGEGGLKKREHDLVVLTVGFLPNTEAFKLYKGSANLEADEFNYVREVDPVSEPGKTNIDGLFAAGAILGARDIPDTVLHSGAAATQAATYLEGLENK